MQVNILKVLILFILLPFFVNAQKENKRILLAEVKSNIDPRTNRYTKLLIDEAKNENYDIILTGKETINYNGAQIGGMIAEMLDIPFVSLATKLDVNGSTATLERDVKGGVEVVEVNTPFAISAAKGMAEQRIPNMRGIMAARTKPLNVVSPVEQDALSSVVKFELPDAKSGCKYIEPENMDELVELLHNESKVL